MLNGTVDLIYFKFLIKGYLKICWQSFEELINEMGNNIKSENCSDFGWTSIQYIYAAQKNFVLCKKRNLEEKKFLMN